MSLQIFWKQKSTKVKTKTNLLPYYSGMTIVKILTYSFPVFFMHIYIYSKSLSLFCHYCFVFHLIIDKTLVTYCQVSDEGKHWRCPTVWLRTSYKTSLSLSVFICVIWVTVGIMWEFIDGSYEVLSLVCTWWVFAVIRKDFFSASAALHVPAIEFVEPHLLSETVWLIQT